jgi:trehalose 6-phosphate phosphatase
MQHSNRDRTLLEAETSKRPRISSARSRVEQLVSARAPVALFLDIDGTLLDVALTPSAVHVPPDLSELLAGISAGLSGAFAIVTGRPIREADRLLKPLKFSAAGVHGAEMRLTANGDIVSLTSSFDAALTADLKSVAQGMPGIVVEDKGAGIALHYRLAPELQSSLLLALEALVPKYPGQFAICEGRKVVEVLPVGLSKGWALRQLAALPEFIDRTPVMIGDDVADLDAFRVAEDMGGYGLKVAGENFSSAEASFRGPSEVLDWLKLFRAGL